MGQLLSGIVGGPAEDIKFSYGLKVVMVSDTHNKHRDVEVPEGDILIHAGDFTRYGKIEDAIDTNEWLGTLTHKHKIVINGNHESNAPWKRDVRSIMSNATVLIDESVEIDTPSGEKLIIYGTNFTWPMPAGEINPCYEAIPYNAGIIISHGPPSGYVDGDRGCPVFTRRCQNIASSQLKKGKLMLRLVVCGHIHFAHGRQTGSTLSGVSGVEFVNAAMERPMRAYVSDV